MGKAEASGMGDGSLPCLLCTDSWPCPANGRLRQKFCHLSLIVTTERTRCYNPLGCVAGAGAGAQFVRQSSGMSANMERVLLAGRQFGHRQAFIGSDRGPVGFHLSPHYLSAYLFSFGLRGSGASRPVQILSPLRSCRKTEANKAAKLERKGQFD